MKIAGHRWPLTVLYTAAFVVIAAFSFEVLSLANRTLIWNMDGITQHYPLIIELHRLLTQHGLSGVTGWSWTLGLGADKLTTLAYYVLGDPFAYLLALLPTRFLESGYGWFVIIRLYCTGLAFLPLARHFRFKPLSQLLGTLTYAFTGYSLMVGVHHPFFLLPMIWLPLLFWGIERILDGDHWAFLGVMTAVAVLSNFYFAYILGLGSLIYAIIRYLSRRAVGEQLPTLGRLSRRFLYAAGSGILTAGILLVPAILMMLQSTRAAGTFANGLWLYPFSYYLKMGAAVLTTGNVLSYWTVLGMSGLTYLGGIYVCLHWRQYRYLAGTLGLIVVGLGFPAVAAFFNVLSTPSNRWLLLATIPFNLATMVLVDHLSDLTNRDRRWFGGGTAGLLGLVYLSNGLVFDDPGRNLITYGLFLALTAVLVGGAAQPAKLTTGLVCGLVGLNLINNAWGYYDPNAGQQATQQLRKGDATKYIQEYYDGAQRAVKGEKTFSRVNTLPSYNLLRTVGNNFTMLHGLHGVMSYFSVENGYVGQFSQDLQNAQYAMNSPLTQLDNRSSLNHLLGVKTIFARQDQIVNGTALPYGYHAQSTVYREQPVYGLSNGTGTQLLTTKLNFPLVYSQPQALTTHQWRQLTSLDRERSLTQAAVVTHRDHGVKAATYRSHQKSLSYHVTPVTTPILDNLNKVVQYRLDQAVTGQKGNLSDKQTANFGQTLTAPKLPVDQTGILNERALKQYTAQVGLTHPSPSIQRLILQNQQIIDTTSAVNQNGLKQMTSDVQGQPITYTLTLDRPNQAQGTELYLALDGISAQPRRAHKQLKQQDNTSTLGATPRSDLTKLNAWRTAISSPDLGDYWVTVKTRNQATGFSQFGVDNLSDYEPKRRVLLNLGYSRQKRQTIDITFNQTQGINFKAVKLLAMPFNASYDRQVQSVKRRGLRHARVTNNQVTGRLKTTQASVLTTSIPYSRGWHLMVDGQSTPTQVVNDGFVGAQVGAGNHRIVLTYRTPGWWMGLVCSLLGIGSLLFGWWWSWFHRPLHRR